MVLYKFCEERFNPKLGCKTFQLGTLLQYREMEEKYYIADRNEGADTVFIDSYKHESADLHLKERMQSFGFFNVTMKDCIIDSKYPNCYIFCLSGNIKKSLSGEGFSEEYNSFYIISNLEKFINAMAKSLLKTLRVEDFEDNQFIKKEHNKSVLDGVTLSIRHEKVKYFGRKQTIITNSKITNGPIITRQDDVIFNKDFKYITDDEYRIAFIFSKNNIVIPVKKNPVLIPAESLLEFIELP